MSCTHGGAVVRRAGDRDLELARQEGELRVQVDHWRMISHQTRGSTISSAATPAKWSAVTLRMQLPLVWMACISTLGQVGEDVRHVVQLRPVVLDVLARVKWP
jgi:hypothetical protein